MINYIIKGIVSHLKTYRQTYKHSVVLTAGSKSARQFCSCSEYLIFINIPFYGVI